MQFDGRYFDGETGVRLEVSGQIELNSQTIRILHPDFADGQIVWRMQDIRALAGEARTDQMTLTQVSATSVDSSLVDLPRLVVRDPEFISTLITACPDLRKRDMKKGTARRIATRVGMAIAAVCVMLFVILPSMADVMARFIPIERETRWGRSVVAQMERLFGGDTLGSLACQSEAGRDALDAMLARLTRDTELAYDLNIIVFDHEMVNAFAAPGGQIVLLRGLIEQADGPDEVAAVLAHEIAHVENRDATRNALRAAGSAGLLSMVIGDFAGGSAALVVAELTLNASYTRDAETKADAYAHEMLDKAGISTVGMADFFAKLHAEETHFRLPEYLASHPETDQRQEAARQFASAQLETTSVLTQAEWTAFQAICN